MKTFSQSFIYLFIVILFSCSKPTSQNEATINNQVETTTTTDINTPSFFNPNDNFRILDTQKNNDYPSSYEGVEICDVWDIKSKNKLSRIIKNAKIISENEFNENFDHLPCQIVGTISQKSNQYDLSINSGAWITISSGDEKMILGVFNSEDDEEFLSTAWGE